MLFRSVEPATIFLSLGIPLRGWLLEYSRWVILLIVNLVLPSVGLRSAMWSRVRKAPERDLACPRRAGLLLSLTLITALTSFERLGPEFLHHVAVLRGVSRWGLRHGMLRTRAFEHLVIIARLLPTETPLLLALVSEIGRASCRERV